MDKKQNLNQPEKENDTTNKNSDSKKEETSNTYNEEENFLFNLIKESLLEEKDKEKDKQKEKDKNTLLNKLPNVESGFLSSSLTKLQNGDDMDIMSELMLLCEHLSLSSDQIGDNPNMPKILEEICKNLEKVYLPEIIIYSLQCINYILDINPGLTSVIKRIGAIPKIIALITSMEDTACLELIVSVFEKISFENSFLLLENNVFLSLLNVIDFLAFPQRKSIMKTCLNISVNSLTIKQFDLYIKPALEQLCSLTKFSEDNGHINEKAILIFYNIIVLLNQGFYFNNNPELENVISKYTFMDNFCEILKLYFIHNNKKITADLVKKILKVINIMFQVSKKQTDKLLSLGILDIVVEIIHHEFNDVISNNENNKISNEANNINSNTAKLSASFYTELFSLLTSLFPNSEKEKKEKDEKILRKENEKYYNFLSENIIKPLVDNIMTKSSCSTLNNLIKLIFAFSKTSSKEYIENYLNPKQMAQIISKLLDTKYEPYVNDLISLLEIFMTKVPEHFIKNFIREGIVENIKNYKFEKEEKKDNEKIKKMKKKKEDKNIKDNKDKDKEDSFSDILDAENNYSEGYYDMENDNDDNYDDNDNYIDDLNDSGKDDDNFKKKEEIKTEVKKEEEITKEEIKKEETNKEIKKEEEIKKKEEPNKEEIKKEEYLEKFELKFTDLSKDLENKSIFEQQKLLKEILERTKRLKNKESDLMNKGKKVFLEIKMKEFIEKYLTDEKIKSFLEKVKFKELINLKNTLISLEKELKSANESNDQNQIKNILEKILSILCEPKNEITLFELENSNILIGLCNYFEPIFKTQYDKLHIENDNELHKNIKMNELIPSPLIKNKNIFEKANLFLQCLAENKNKLINYIKLLQFSITSMNCFTMVVDSQSNYNLNIYYNQSKTDEKKISLRVIYSEEPYKEKIENNKTIEDKNFMEKLKEYNKALISMKEVKFLLNENSVFDDMSSILLSNTNVTFVANETYDVIVVYFLKLKVDSAEEKFAINENWKHRELKKELLKKYGRTKGPIYFDSPIYFGIDFKKKEKVQNEEKKEERDIDKKIIDFIEYLSPFNEDISGYNHFIDINKILFIKEYHTDILYSKSLYEIKRLMPSLFLLSIMYLSLKKYRTIFNLNENWFKNWQEWNDLFINSKVNLLISKASMDGYSVSRSSTPSWCKNISYDCGFLTKFEFRSLLYKVSFDQRRSLINLQNYFKSIDPNYPHEYNITIEKSMRLKIIVERDKILDHGFTLLNDAVTSKFFGFLEFEYKGEIGNGLGPTLEFFNLIFEKLREEKYLWYKTTDGSWYPNVGLNENETGIKMFKLLGYIIGRAIYDDRLIDIPLSRVFWNLILERPVLFEDIEIIDKNLFKALNDFKSLLKQKNDLLKSEPNLTGEEIENKILYNNNKLSSLDIYFTFPGTDLELKEGGANILLSMQNIEEYINLIYDFIFYKGISRICSAFRDGFCLITGVYNLKCFTSLELEEFICSSREVKWDENILYENLKPEHGYTKNSRIYDDLIKFMCKLDKLGQRQFLIFTTGTSRLPIGGFKALSPKLTIVKKTFEKGDIPDNYLPTVMTCQNYLKLPEYSNYEILEKKMLLAMREGGKEFNLS